MQQRSGEKEKEGYIWAADRAREEEMFRKGKKKGGKKLLELAECGIPTEEKIGKKNWSPEKIGC